VANDIKYVLFGITLIVVGIDIINGLKFITNKFSWTFNFAPLNIFVGLIMIAFGVLSLWSVIRKRLIKK
jgi:hypothetical protein